MQEFYVVRKAMVRTKYGVRDDAQGQLAVSISSVATSLVLKSGQGALMPTTPFIGTIAELDGNGEIVKKEKVEVTLVTGDTLTVERGFDGSTALAFVADDSFYNFVTALPIQEMQQGITDLETDKLNASGELRTGMSADRLIYIDSSGNEQELGLGTANQYLQGDLTRGSPPLDVFGQTTITALDRANDYLAISDGSDSNTTKKMIIDTIAPLASETTAGLVERATDSEATTGTDTTRYITPKQVKDNYSDSYAKITGSNSSLTTVHAHGLGKTPKHIQFYVNGYVMQCHGFWTATATGCMYMQSGSGSEKGTYVTPIHCHKSSGAFATGTVTVDATNVTITWSSTSGLAFIALVTA